MTAYRSKIYALALLAALTGCQDPIYRTSVVSGYCEQYHRVITKSDDVPDVHSLPRSLRDRVVANELAYRCACTNFKNPACDNVGQK